MRSLLAAIPQGIIWYPAIVVIFAAAAAALWRLYRRSGQRRRLVEQPVEHLEAIARLVRRGRTDTMASLDLERKALGFLLACHGYPGYSATNCRAFLADGPPEEVAGLIRAHLSEIHAEPGARRIPYRNGLPERVAAILERIEIELEV